MRLTPSSRATRASVRYLSHTCCPGKILKPVCMDMALMQAKQRGEAELERTSARTNGFCLAGAVLMLPLRLHTAHSKSLSSAHEARLVLALPEAS